MSTEFYHRNSYISFALSKFLYLLIASLIFTPIPLSAETKELYGLEFDYGDLKIVDHNLFHLTLNDKDQIIAEGDLDLYVVRTNFFDLEKVYSLEELSNFFDETLKREKYELALLTLRKVSTLPGLDFAKIESVVEKFDQKFLEFSVRSNNNILVSFKNMDSLFWQFAYWQLYLIAPRDSHLEKELFKKFQYNNDLIEKILDYQIIQYILKDRDQAKGEELIKDFQRRLNVNTKVQYFIDFYRNYYVFLDNLKKGQNIKAPYKRLKDNYTDHFLPVKEHLHKKIFKQIEYFIEKKNLKSAFDALLLMDFNKRNETVHNLVYQIVENIDIPHSPLLLIDPYRRNLVSFSTKDKRIKQKIIASHEAIINHFLDKNDPNSVNDYFESLKTFRPDPDPKNNEILKKQIETFQNKGLTIAAESHYQKYGKHLTTSDRIGLMFKDNYFRIACLFAIAFGILVLNKRFRLLERIKEGRHVEEEELDTEPPLSYRVNALSPRQQKYSSLLNFFELNHDAQLGDIKKAYRNKIKNFHPDLNPDTLTSDNQEQFINITQKYEDLLQLFDELGNVEVESDD